MAHTGSRTPQHDLHLVEGEDVRPFRRPIPEPAVPVEDPVDESIMPIRREQPSPFDESRTGEMDKRVPRLEVPFLLLDIEALDAEPAPLGESAVLIGCDVEIRRVVAG